MTAGKQKYILPIFVDRYFQNSMRKYVTANYKNPDVIMEAIDANDSIKLSELLDSPVELYKQKADHGKVANEFLTSIKTK